MHAVKGRGAAGHSAHTLHSMPSLTILEILTQEAPWFPAVSLSLARCRVGMMVPGAGPSVSLIRPSLRLLKSPEEQTRKLNGLCSLWIPEEPKDQARVHSPSPEEKDLLRDGMLRKWF